MSHSVKLYSTFHTDSEGRYHYPAVIYVRCVAGYSVIGPGVMKCLANGTWSRGSPRCTGKKMDLQIEVGDLEFCVSIKISKLFVIKEYFKITCFS